MYGAFLRSVRESRGLTQLELGEITGITQSNLSAYENDRQIPSIDIVNTIVVGCGYSLKAVAGDAFIDVPLARGGWTRSSGCPIGSLPIPRRRDARPTPRCRWPSVWRPSGGSSNSR